MILVPEHKKLVNNTIDLITLKDTVKVVPNNFTNKSRKCQPLPSHSFHLYYMNKRT